LHKNPLAGYADGGSSSLENDSLNRISCIEELCIVVASAISSFLQYLQLCLKEIFLREYADILSNEPFSARDHKSGFAVILPER
jgi:hypothetical protein